MKVPRQTFLSPPLSPPVVIFNIALDLGSQTTKSGLWVIVGMGYSGVMGYSGLWVMGYEVEVKCRWQSYLYHEEANIRRRDAKVYKRGHSGALLL